MVEARSLDGSWCFDYYLFDNKRSPDFSSKTTSRGSSQNINTYAFSGCNKLEYIEIPNSVFCLGDGVFSGCNDLKLVKLSNSLRQIGAMCFAMCKNIRNLDIPDSVEKICFSAFSGCTKLENVHLSNKLSIISVNTFDNCDNLKQLVVPDSVTYIDREAIINCEKLESIVLGRGLEAINANFSKCPNLVSIFVHQKTYDDIEYLKEFDDKIVILDKSLEKLLEEGKSFKEANEIIEINKNKEALLA